MSQVPDESRLWSGLSYINLQNLSPEKVTIVLPNAQSQDLEPTKKTKNLSMPGDYYIRKAGTTQGVVNYWKFNLDTKGGATLERLGEVPPGTEFQAFFCLN